MTVPAHIVIPFYCQPPSIVTLRVATMSPFRHPYVTLTRHLRQSSIVTPLYCQTEPAYQGGYRGDNMGRSSVARSLSSTVYRTTLSGLSLTPDLTEYLTSIPLCHPPSIVTFDPPTGGGDNMGRSSVCEMRPRYKQQRRKGKAKRYKRTRHGPVHER